MAAAPAAAQLAAGQGDHLDAGLAQPGVGVDIAVIGHHHPGRDAQQVVDVVPLLALGLVGVAAGGQAADFRQAHGLRQHVDQGPGLAAHIELAIALARPQAVHADRIHHLGEERGQAVVLVGVAPPDLGGDAARVEQRMEAVDRRHQQRLLAPGRPVLGAQHQAIAYPAAVVAGEQGVGQRRRQQIGRAGALAQQAAGLDRQLGACHAADQVLGQLGGGRPSSQGCNWAAASLSMKSGPSLRSSSH